MICDFCSGTPVRWRYPARSFSHSYTLAGLNVQGNSEGDWAACDECHAIIQASNREALAARSWETFPIPHSELPAQVRLEIRQQIRGMHDVFWSQREGAPAPIALEGT